MNIYTVSTGRYSYYSEWKLCHDTKYTPEEFNKMVVNICEDLSTRDDCFWYGEDIVKELIKKHEFKTFKYISCHAFDYSYGDTQNRIPVSVERDDSVD